MYFSSDVSASLKMRRSRVQVRPNIGARQTKSVEVKEEETKKVKGIILIQ